MEKLKETICLIDGLNTEAQEQMEQHLNSLTKPLGSLGILESLAIKIAGITGNTKPEIDPAMVVLMAADHGVTAEGVSAFPSEVTQQMVRNFITGGAAINVLSRAANASVQIVDIGVNGDLQLPGVINRKIRYGTNNMAQGPAMESAEAIAAIEAGIETAQAAIQKGAKLLALGEMGIGNTTASSAMLAVLGQIPVEQIVGSGTGINTAEKEKKANVIKRAIEVNQPNPADPIDVLAKVGGLEIAGLTGIVLGAAAARIPILIDGYITAVAALTAVRITSTCVHYLIASHQSVEPGHIFVNKLLGLQPLVNLNLRLGEGSGTATALPIVRSAIRIANEMATFEQAGVSGSNDGSVKGAAEVAVASEILPTEPTLQIATRHEFDGQQKQGVYHAIYSRRDIRSFIKHPIEEEKLRRIMKAAHHAPSVGFMQPWNFIMVRSDEIKQQLHDVVSKEVEVAGRYFEDERSLLYPKLKVEGILEAPVTICFTCNPTSGGEHVLGRNTIPETDAYSVVCAIQNLWLAARAEGLGVGWVSFYKKQDIRKILNIPPHIEPIGLLSVGYTHQFQEQPILETVGWGKRIPLDELIYTDKWGKQ
ncbi:nicotinate-nucleotide--dimethylbenzimidazole phosphoribosyltransferase [Neobacillus niacini]|uniref:nicotinate-nucleotide--dimethylbenzimidazole phosphoribosyltransferase n=1 Tax=Neobacillus niacini TaxID=86668 RepID=UPI00285A801A|nr:nicotinate-nucleotide--dimethylbenzimidazole phosphoribosyltransferase [Neobacillus niacini]MDR7000178.1 nicotinate-nucleotide--dimethylbenzimidazole phosphoribosyltransferase [Neobacillus niacini]